MAVEGAEFDSGPLLLALSREEAQKKETTDSPKTGKENQRNTINLKHRSMNLSKTKKKLQVQS